jgi:tetratricopeptide (TPR) repeat protein
MTTSNRSTDASSAQLNHLLGRLTLDIQVLEEHRDPEFMRRTILEVCSRDLRFEDMHTPDQLAAADPALMRQEAELLADYNDWKRINSQLTDRGFKIRPSRFCSVVDQIGDLFGSADPDRSEDFAFALDTASSRFKPSYAMSYAIWFFMEIERCALALASTEAEDANDRGQELVLSQAFSEALPHFHRAVQLSPTFALAWINCGIALKNLGRIDDALQVYAIVIGEIDSDYKKAWYNAAVAFLKVGDAQYAYDCCRKSVEIDPKYAPGLKLLPDIQNALASVPPEVPVAEQPNDIVILGMDPELAKGLATSFGSRGLSVARIDESGRLEQFGAPAERRERRRRWNEAVRKAAAAGASAP